MLFNKIRDQLITEIHLSTNLPQSKIKDSLQVSATIKDFMLIIPKIFSGKAADTQLINDQLQSIKMIESTKIVDPNIFISVKKDNYSDFFEDINSFTGFNFGNNEKVVIDYSSPNIAKVFHIGHFRSTMIGNFIKNLLKKCGHEVVSVNYLGDWGKQFGIIGSYFLRNSNVEKLKENPLKHLYELYVKAHEEISKNPEMDDLARKFFMEMENGNEEYLKLWRMFREFSIKNYETVYEKLGVSFDFYHGEKMYAEKGRFYCENPIVETDEDGSKIIKLNEKENFLILKKDGSTLYQTRDIACAFERNEIFKADKIVYVVANEQKDYFRKLFLALDRLNFRGRGIHVGYGMILGMSTRKGNVIFLDDVIEDTKVSMLEVMKKNEDKFKAIIDVDETALVLAISGLIVQDFSARRDMDYTFKIERCTGIEGKTGPYLQYSHCRISGIEEKNKSVSVENCDYGVLNGHKSAEEVQKLLFLLIQYPNLILKVYKSMEPCEILDYLMKIAKLVNRLFNDLKVIGEEEKVASARLSVFLAAKKVLGDGMKLLGMKLLTKM